MVGTAVDWDFWLGRSSDMSRIVPLQNAHARSITYALNDRESASFQISVFDDAYPYLDREYTCLLAYRNKKLKWSGPILTISDQMPNATVDVGCVGWFEHLNHLQLYTGNLGPNPSAPNSGWSTQGQMTATTLYYNAIEQCQLGADLVGLSIQATQQIDHAPVFVTLGSVPNSGLTRNITYQEFTPIGQSLQKLSQMEAGFDFRVDPVTRQINMYYDPVGPPGTTVRGRGQVRTNAIFGYHCGPWNIGSLSRSFDRSKIANRVFGVGQYGIGTAIDQASADQYGVWASQSSLSDVVQEEILTAFAASEVATLSQPTIIYTFDQMPLAAGSSTLQPFDDFDIGDYCFLASNYGILIPPGGPKAAGNYQPVRIFSFKINISDEGVEAVQQIQTSYQAAT